MTWALLENAQESEETVKPDKRAGGAGEWIELKIWVNSKGEHGPWSK